MTRLGRADKRCDESASGKLWQCIGCVGTLLSKHADILRGHLSESSQFDSPIAWAPATLFGGPAPRAQPKDKKAKEDMRRIFRIGGKVDGRNAVVKHIELQKVITAALEEDKARGGKQSAKSSF